MRKEKNTILPESISRIRRDKGLTLADFGKLLDPPVTKSVVYKWENGLSKPTKMNLKKLAKLANTDVNTLLFGNLYYFLKKHYDGDIKKTEIALKIFEKDNMVDPRESSDSLASIDMLVVNELDSKQAHTNQGIKSYSLNQIKHARGLFQSFSHRIRAAEEVPFEKSLSDQEKIIAMLESDDNSLHRPNREELYKGINPKFYEEIKNIFLEAENKIANLDPKSFK